MTDTDTSTAEQRDRIIELARKIPIAMLTTIDDDGHLVGRPMSPREITDTGELWFFIERDSRTATELVREPRVGVSLTSGSSFLSFAGRAAIVDDPGQVHRLWDAAVEAWLPEGPDDPSVALVRVSAVSGEYWDSPGGRIATLISFVKAKVTGERYDGGENEVVELG